MDVAPAFVPMGPDPYDDAEAAAERALRDVQRLQPAAFAGDGGAAVRLPAALAALCDQLSALEAAVSAMAVAPHKFRLTPAAVAARRARVQGLRLEAEDAARLASGGAAGAGRAFWGCAAGGGGGGGGLDAFRAPGGPGGAPWGPPGGGGAARGKAETYYQNALGRAAGAPAAAARPPWWPAADAGGSGGADAYGFYVERGVQQQMMVEQDGMLDDIEAHVGRIKHVGLAMHGELEEQSLLLGEFESDADAAALRLRGARRKTRQLLDAAKADRQLQLIAALCAILAILVVTAFL